MFELDREVRDWRTRVERSSSLSARELDELEDHLRARVDLELQLNPALTSAKALAVAVGGLGAPAAGYVRDITGSYDPAWWAGVALMALGAVLTILTPPPRRRDEEEGET